MCPCFVIVWALKKNSKESYRKSAAQPHTALVLVLGHNAEQRGTEIHLEMYTHLKVVTATWDVLGVSHLM